MHLSLRLVALLFALFPLLAAPAQAARDPRGPGRPKLPSETAPPPETEAEAPNLDAYRVLTILDLGAGEGLRKDYQQALASGLADRLAEAVSAAPELELMVRRGDALGTPDELVLSGILVDAKKGSRIARYFVGPLARARIVTDMRLRDGATGEVLAEGRIKKLWAWPGWAGVTRGLPGLETGACKEVVDFLRQGRPDGLREERVALAPAEASGPAGGLGEQDAVQVSVARADVPGGEPGL